jgi:excisionase family DNA binding protein
VSLKELAVYLGIHERTIRRWVAAEAIPYLRIVSPGCKRPVLRFDIEDVRNALASSQLNPRKNE